MPMTAGAQALTDELTLDDGGGADNAVGTGATVQEPLSAPVHDPALPELLAALDCALVMTSYQAGKVLTVRSDDHGIDTHHLACPRPMGLAVDGDRLTLGIWSQLLDYRRDGRVAGEVDGLERVDACFVPRASHVTGMINIHDIAWSGDDLWLVNSNFSCICSLDGEHGFVPRWKPPFISELAPEDRCHLNGLALRDGRPRYVTTFSKFDDPKAWRQSETLDGTVMDIAGDAVLVDGLAMPHSPRYHDGWLYFCESGHGRVWRLDPESGRRELLAELPGFTRGVAFAGRVMFVGLSRARSSQVRRAPPISRRAEETQCGVWALDTRTGRVLAHLRFEAGVEQIYDVAVVAGSRFPEVLEWQDETIQRLYHYPELVPL